MLQYDPYEIHINGWSVKVSLGIIINAIITLISVGIFWGSMNIKLDDTLNRVIYLEKQRSEDFQQIITLRNDLSVAIQKLSDFQSDYEHDANRYIRDLDDKRRSH